jgi:hypothetical protein
VRQDKEAEGFVGEDSWTMRNGEKRVWVAFSGINKMQFASCNVIRSNHPSEDGRLGMRWQKVVVMAKNKREKKGAGKEAPHFVYGGLRRVKYKISDSKCACPKETWV